MTEQNDHDAELDAVLTGVGPRLRRLRKDRGVTLAGLSEATGISVSTLSRLESGGRMAQPGAVAPHRPGP